MAEQQPCDIVIAGHICVDVIVELDTAARSVGSHLVPGKLIEVGAPTIAGGGAVFNTGTALHRLGRRVRLIGKVGGDLYGQATLDVLKRESPSLAREMVVVSDTSSSYTLVLSSPHIDRVFLHHPGSNDTFVPEDVAERTLEGANILHFGYPPLMKQIFSDGGGSLAALFQRAQDKGLIVSLDMAKPDPDSDAGKADWRAWLTTVLPHTDIFLPSFDELLFMLNRPLYDRLSAESDSDELVSGIDGSVLNELSDELLSMGVAIVVIKLGEEGLYLRTTNDRARLLQIGSRGSMGGRDSKGSRGNKGSKDRDHSSFCQWRSLERLRPCFMAEVVGTTGSGDSAIAGFLSALCEDDPDPDLALKNAAAVGACSVEAASSISAIPSQEEVTQRIGRGWPQRESRMKLPGWEWDSTSAIWRGPSDSPEPSGSSI